MSYEMDMPRFWEENARCLALGKAAPRVPVSIDIPGDWVCLEMGLDNARYYSEFDYHQEMRLRCGERTKRELALELLPDIDFGVVMDASVYGGRVRYESNATPTLEPVVREPGEVWALAERMEKTDLLNAGLVPMYFEWREKLRARYGLAPRYGLSLKGAATMLGQLCGITNFLTWVLTDPEEMHALAACWLRTSLRYLKAMRKATGCEAVDDTFSLQSDVSGMMSPELYRGFLMEAERVLYDNFASKPGAVRYYHADSHMLHLLPMLGEIGVNQTNIDPYITPAEILGILPNAVVHGQIPPTAVLLNGSAEQVVACARANIAQAGPGSLILTTAGSINPGTSYENLRAMCWAAERGVTV